MSIKKIDARGLSCPQPVLLAQKAIDEGNAAFELLVDNEVAKENIFRLAKRSGMSVKESQEGSDVVISIAK